MSWHAVKYRASNTVGVIKESQVVQRLSDCWMVKTSKAEKGKIFLADAIHSCEKHKDAKLAAEAVSGSSKAVKRGSGKSSVANSRVTSAKRRLYATGRNESGAVSSAPTTEESESGAVSSAPTTKTSASVLASLSTNGNSLDLNLETGSEGKIKSL